MITERIVQSLVKEGSITIEDFKDKVTLRKKIDDIVGRCELILITDYTDNLLQTAKNFKKEGKIDNFKLFYAICFEHLMNGFIVDVVCIRKSIDKKTINDIIKSVNMNGKITWLLTLLELPPITSHHKKTLLKLNEDRNSYVHYKYNPKPDEIDKDEDTKIKEEFRQIEKTIIYFKRYISKVLYNNSKTEIDKHLKKLLK